MKMIDRQFCGLDGLTVRCRDNHDDCIVIVKSNAGDDYVYGPFYNSVEAIKWINENAQGFDARVILMNNIKESDKGMWS